MVPANEFKSGFEMGEVLELAQTITAREVLEFAFMRAATNSGNPPNPKPVISIGRVKELYLDRAARNILRIQYPDQAFDMTSVVDLEMSDTYGIVAEDVARLEGKEVNFEQTRGIMLGNAMAINEVIGITEEQLAQDFSDLFAAAKSVAKEYSTTVEEVYDTNELYAEAFRSVYSLEKFSARYEAMIKNGVTLRILRRKRYTIE